MSHKGENVMVSNMKLEKMLCMKGGKDQTSYANNSQAQVNLLSHHFLYDSQLFTRKREKF